MRRYVAYDEERGENQGASYGYNCVEAAVVNFLEEHGSKYGISIDVEGPREG